MFCSYWVLCVLCVFQTIGPYKMCCFQIFFLPLYIAVFLPLNIAVCCSVTKFCLTLCDPMNCSTTILLCSEVCSHSCPFSWWCHSTASSSFASSPALNLSSIRVFTVSRLLTLGHQNIGASTSASVLPKNIQGWFSLGLTGLISLLSTGLSRLQHHNSKASVLWYSAFIMVEHSHLYMTAEKKHNFDYMDLCWQSDVSAFKYTV